MWTRIENRGQGQRSRDKEREIRTDRQKDTGYTWKCERLKSRETEVKKEREKKCEMKAGFFLHNLNVKRKKMTQT